MKISTELKATLGNANNFHDSVKFVPSSGTDFVYLTGNNLIYSSKINDKCINKVKWSIPVTNSKDVLANAIDICTTQFDSNKITLVITTSNKGDLCLVEITENDQQPKSNFI